MHLIHIVGMGPGAEAQMTLQALTALEESDTIIGYSAYLKLLDERFLDKELLSTPMKREVERCRLCFERALAGRRVALICSGDAGVYGMASLMYELLPEYRGCELIVVPGVTAALSGAALLGAPLNHDFCVISLSDLLTPWEQIERRLQAAVAGDFAIAIYNPSSHQRPDYLRRACNIMLSAGAAEERACGLVENIGREGTRTQVCSLDRLKECEVNMFTTVFIGNSQTRILDGKLVTPRGYAV